MTRFPRILSLLLLPGLLIAGAANGQSPRSRALAWLRPALAAALEDSLPEGAVTQAVVQNLLERALDREFERMRGLGEWLDDRRGGALRDVRQSLERRIARAGPFDPSAYPGSTRRQAVDLYLARLLGNTGVGLEAAGADRVSDYRFIVGGIWAHTDSSSAKGLFAASFHLRTRLWHPDGPEGQDITADGDEQTAFVDLLVNADFLTNQPFNKAVLDPAANPDSAVADLILESVRASKLAFALYWPLPVPVFKDGGRVGPFGRFAISTREGSEDVFRQFSFGLRAENRRRGSYIEGASAEVGFTSNRAVGSLEGRVELGDIGDRVLLDLVLPIHSRANRFGMFAEFHGEWRPSWADSPRVLVNASGAEEDILPPTYQFRLGATFDPAEILGPVFGRR